MTSIYSFAQLHEAVNALKALGLSGESLLAAANVEKVPAIQEAFKEYREALAIYEGVRVTQARSLWDKQGHKIWKWESYLERVPLYPEMRLEPSQEALERFFLHQRWPCNPSSARMEWIKGHVKGSRLIIHRTEEHRRMGIERVSIEEAETYLLHHPSMNFVLCDGSDAQNEWQKERAINCHCEPGWQVSRDPGTNEFAFRLGTLSSMNCGMHGG